ncbi:glycosyltransferase family 4 protein [Ensifer soli]|uniref:glycosyltransferase family 4 protein n=1 Tax=Ciceribacter sp. sgz301302 TaxID=3342379 RepID=UPI0035BA5D68
MSKPRIMIDGYNLALEKGTGIATYARNLSEQATGLGHKVDLLYGVKAATGKNALLSEVTFFDPGGKPVTTSQVVRRLATSPWGMTAKQVPITGKVISTTFRNRLPTYDRMFNLRDAYSFCRWHFRVYRQPLPVTYEEPASIAHWTYPMPIKLKGAANIYTIHDLVPLRLPFATLDNKREFYRIVRNICDKADHIVTVSEISKRDIVELMGIDESRVTNTYQAVNLPKSILERSDETVINEVESIFALENRNYFLFFGAIEPKKNVGRIIEAYLASGSKIPLVIVGQLVWKNDDELRLLNMKMTDTAGRERPPVGKPGVSSSRRSRGGGGAASIIKLDYLPLSMLASLIRCARAVVFPSLYEGFGLPILEAMQLGTAVLTGDQGANPEVAGDSALIVDPYSVASIAAGLRTLGSDDDLLAHLQAAGRERAKLFSPAVYDQRLTELYTKLA